MNSFITAYTVTVYVFIESYTVSIRLYKNTVSMGRFLFFQNSLPSHKVYEICRFVLILGSRKLRFLLDFKVGKKGHLINLFCSNESYKRKSLCPCCP